ncbi:MAG: prepilin-type N-terminal cleavage/methylation domain-containing protein [bacterium]|nr:prepilin-type N-terminal cleavage/methylation domain-containing protein [bacterium]
MFLQNTKKSKKNILTTGFTIIELIVVIAIIAVLASIVMVNVSSFRAKARDARRISDLRNIRTALDMYFVDNGFYPPSGCGYDCNGYSYSYNSSWQTLENYLKPYLSSLPKDPINSGCPPWSNDCYSYSYGNVGNTVYTPQYDLTGQLEIKNNPLACKSKCYKWYFNASYSWCTDCGGSYSNYIYEASP